MTEPPHYMPMEIVEAHQASVGDLLAVSEIWAPVIGRYRTPPVREREGTVHLSVVVNGTVVTLSLSARESVQVRRNGI